MPIHVIARNGMTKQSIVHITAHVIARNEVTKQSIFFSYVLDCRASLAMTEKGRSQ